MKNENFTVLDGNPFMVAEKDSIRVLWLNGDYAELKTCPEHFCGPIFCSRESGERKITELKKRLPAFEFELITRETLPFTFKVISGEVIRTRKQIKS
jgi:hypothetical protein